MTHTISYQVCNVVNISDNNYFFRYLLRNDAELYMILELKVFLNSQEVIKELQVSMFANEFIMTTSFDVRVFSKWCVRIPFFALQSRNLLKN